MSNKKSSYVILIIIMKNGVQQGDVLACLLFHIMLEKVIQDEIINIRDSIM